MDMDCEELDTTLELKQIEKEGLSEYFLYTIEGTEDLPNTWAKRLPSFDVDDIPVKSLYKYDEDRYGNQTVRFVSFKNDAEHELGTTPIPEGTVKIYRNLNDVQNLSYIGQSSVKYIPQFEMMSKFSLELKHWRQWACRMLSVNRAELFPHDRSIQTTIQSTRTAISTAGMTTNHGN